MPEKTMPFGKHKDKAISECPIDYLDWLIGQDWMDEKFPELKKDIEDYLKCSSEWQRM